MAIGFGAFFDRPTCLALEDIVVDEEVEGVVVILRSDELGFFSLLGGRDLRASEDEEGTTIEEILIKVNIDEKIGKYN